MYVDGAVVGGRASVVVRSLMQHIFATAVPLLFNPLLLKLEAFLPILMSRYIHLCCRSYKVWVKPQIYFAYSSSSIDMTCIKRACPSYASQSCRLPFLGGASPDMQPAASPAATSAHLTLEWISSIILWHPNQNMQRTRREPHCAGASGVRLQWNLPKMSILKSCETWWERKTLRSKDMLSLLIKLYFFPVFSADQSYDQHYIEQIRRYILESPHFWSEKKKEGTHNYARRRIARNDFFEVADQKRGSFNGKC